MLYVLTGENKRVVQPPTEGSRSKRRNGQQESEVHSNTNDNTSFFSHCVPDGQGTLAPGEER